MAFKRKVYHKEENCLNCGYPLVGQFCANCGQKAFLHKDSFLHMVAHFVGDYFHYDSKFWRTIKEMALQPGGVTLDYINGKRVRYINPIQLYFFITTIFFIVALSDSAPKAKVQNKVVVEQRSDSLQEADRNLTGLSTKNGKTRFGIGELTPAERSLAAYDSTQRSLPHEKRDGFFLNRIRRKSYDEGNDIGDQITHNLPKMLFILLPLFALMLSILFRKSRMYYVDHLIFSIHFHAVIFAIFLLNILLVNLWQNETFDSLLSFLVFTGIVVYLFIAMKKVYPSSAWKIFLKLVFLLFAYLVCLIFAFLILLTVIFLFF